MVQRLSTHLYAVMDGYNMRDRTQPGGEQDMVFGR